jgi:ribonuclease HI
VINVEYWRNKNPSFPEDVLVWYTDGSRTDSGTGSGIQDIRPNRGYCFPLGIHATVFQTEIYAILQCAYENIRRAYRNKRILIFSNSQAARKALHRPKVISRLVAEFLDSLSPLTDLNKVTLIWVSGHRDICGNEQADKLAIQASAISILGPEPALGIPKCMARGAIKKWTEHQHLKTWSDTPGCRHGKLFISKPCKKRADNLLRLSRHQLKMTVAFLTGHAPVRERLRIICSLSFRPPTA